MPRKQKNIYEKINLKETQIQQLKHKLSIYETELNQLYKERDSIEMRQIFDTAKANGMSYNQVIHLITKNK